MNSKNYQGKIYTLETTNNNEVKTYVKILFKISTYIIISMSNFLHIDEDESVGRVDIDSLFEKKQQKDLKQLSIFNKILNRIHKRIRLTGNTKVKDKYVFFSIPEFIFGEPLYKQGDCIGYLVVQLEQNGFLVKYIHPNTLFICWENWVPSYVRSEIKKKTGKIINERGEIVADKNANLDTANEDDINAGIMNNGRSGQAKKNDKEYTPIDNYQPSGNFVYKKELFEKLEKKL
jgi:hypothetical protein